MTTDATTRTEVVNSSALLSAPQSEAVEETRPMNEARNGADDGDAGDAPAAPAVKLCGVCNNNPSKYKCSRCYLPYCSVACSRTHRENHPPDPEPKPELQPPTNEEPTAPRNTGPSPIDPENPFRALASSDKLRMLFTKYPSLPDQLQQIYAATMPPKEGSDSRAIPASLMQGVQRKSTWNHDVGIQNGKAALRRARKANGEEGEGVREYTELVLHLLNQEDSQDKVATLLRQKLADQDTQLIERLMAEEKR